MEERTAGTYTYKVQEHFQIMVSVNFTENGLCLNNRITMMSQQKAITFNSIHTVQNLDEMAIQIIQLVSIDIETFQ